MSFSEHLRRLAEPIWQAELEHPFVRGLGDGSLPLDKFRFYLAQDYVFLLAYCKVFALAVAKAHDEATMRHFARLLDATLHQEMDLHRDYASRFGLTPQELEATQPAPTCYAYTRHLLYTAATGSLAEIAAAILPCMWGYFEIGQALKAQGLPASQPLYHPWIETYASEEFGALAQDCRELLDRLVSGLPQEALKSLEPIFLASSRYEYAFWQMAWTLESWQPQ
jgi:thiaminase/transcriptional activator TenA